MPLEAFIERVFLANFINGAIRAGEDLLWREAGQLTVMVVLVVPVDVGTWCFSTSQAQMSLSAWPLSMSSIDSPGRVTSKGADGWNTH